MPVTRKAPIERLNMYMGCWLSPGSVNSSLPKMVILPLPSSSLKKDMIISTSDRPMLIPRTSASVWTAPFLQAKVSALPI